MKGYIECFFCKKLFEIEDIKLSLKEIVKKKKLGLVKVIIDNEDYILGYICNECFEKKYNE